MRYHVKIHVCAYHCARDNLHLLTCSIEMLGLGTGQYARGEVIGCLCLLLSLIYSHCQHECHQTLLSDVNENGICQKCQYFCSVPFSSLIVLQQGCYERNIVIDLVIIMDIIRKLHMKATQSYI